MTLGSKAIFAKIKANKRMAMLVGLILIFAGSGSALLLMRHDINVDATQKSLSVVTAETPQKTTKLAFSDTKNLPKTYKAGDKFTLSFTIQNHEGKIMDYPYTVTFNGTQVAAHTVHVNDRTTQTVKEIFDLPTDQQSLSVEVKLTDQKQAIHFTMTKQ